jgi:hypothetical protein
VRFELTESGLELYRPDGQKFLSYLELEEQRELVAQRAEQEAQRAEQEAQRAERLAAKLRELNIDPDSL